MKTYKNIIKWALCAASVIGLSILLNSCSSKDRVVIYTNADDEAVSAMEHALDAEGLDGQYVFLSFNTSELGGKVMTEGKNIEADLIALSSYYLDSAQKEKNMFLKLDFDPRTLKPSPDYSAPITAQEGTIFYNTKVVEKLGLSIPRSLRDLSKPEYKGQISITNISSSSTAWLMVQALISEYGEDEARGIVRGLIDNAGPHFEHSGSAPLKKVRAGEVAFGFGLRQQAVLDREKGLPINYVDPAEGSFILKESIAVVDHGEMTNPAAMKIAEIIVKKSRAEIIKNYPVALYQGEAVEGPERDIREFHEPLTMPLLKKHETYMAR